MQWKRRSQVYWLDRIGSWVLRVSVIGLVALVTVQLLMTNDPFRLYMGLNQTLGEQVSQKAAPSSTPVPGSTDDTGKVDEGSKAVPVQAPGIDRGDASMTLSLLDYTSLERLTVKVNGKAAGDFSQKELVIAVKNGDIIEIDSTAYPYPVEITIIQSAENLLYPKANQSLTLKKEVARVGPVKLKQ
ncbi:MAG: hypothetical protein HPY50_06135 [Firmicutes bacterium]|nr:hypothetical protein [Bacillota bacterium]